MVKLSTQRFRFFPWFLLGALLLICAIPSLAYAAGDPGSDPLGTAQASVDGGVGLIATYGPVLGSMYLLYQLASRLVAKYASSSWLAKGKRLAFVTGLLGVVGATLQAQIAGSPWNVIVLAAIAAAFKLLTPTVTSVIALASDDTPSDGTPSVSLPTVRITGPIAKVEKSSTLVMLLLIVGTVFGVTVGSACGPKSTAVLNVGVDCTTAARNDLVTALTPTAVSAINKIADPKGKITTEALAALFSGASLKNEAGVILACAEARAVEYILTHLAAPAPEGASQLIASSRIDGDALRGALAAQFPDVAFKTSP